MVCKLDFLLEFHWDQAYLQFHIPVLCYLMMVFTIHHQFDYLNRYYCRHRLLRQTYLLYRPNHLSCLISITLGLFCVLQDQEQSGFQLNYTVGLWIYHFILMVIQHRQDRHLNAHSIFLNASKSRLFLSHAAKYIASLNVFCMVDCICKSAVYTARRLPRPVVCI